jgi:hypothetical protein
LLATAANKTKFQLESDRTADTDSEEDEFNKGKMDFSLRADQMITDETEKVMKKRMNETAVHLSLSLSVSPLSLGAVAHLRRRLLRRRRSGV